MEPVLSPATLTELRRPRPYPAVSVLTPTHRREPENAQDPVRLRNVLAEAKKRLEHDPAVTRERRSDVADQLDRALAEVDLTHAEEGLVIFAAPGEHQVWSLARTVPERVVLADTFLTRNLVAAQAAERPFWVLSVSSDRVALWSGGDDRVTPARVEGFPLTRDRDNFDAERQQRIGDMPSAFRDEDTRHFLRDADTAMSRALRTHPRPLYVTGETAALSLLDEIGTVTKDATPLPHGGLAHGTPEAVWQAIGPMIEAENRRNVDTVARRLEAARGSRTFAAGVDEVRQNAEQGRVQLLAVEENYRATVRADDGGVHLVPAESGELDALDDIVDEIVERCLDTGAEVRFVPDGTLGDAQGIAGVLRY
ncbi:chemotaxis protein [Streptomyces heilongjiangensis]|uniref:Chemotaxis protein n=1 Tax=Streptomyces heilongjiangensis TaxID=945052 RepID=A0ABW1B8F0_9ACTN|nr:chemotaxis protein [Streptomyces heilongjiangensis]MDC2947488.1 chemotaxis protein [Streptomyces heilongjiangensis]